ncbi:PA14 domain-containing protein [Clostridium sp. BNL1100]|uniref:fibronectin type III domain-containing protein n=1 Tax=Clostridium sp. BNL1100 TaxID=755731 RepID=UPI00024A737E|nr:PA14 domain-containing protein [Clostridium sp. BNL1100]AEY65107.1 PA14 domain-containing protein,fibronectin type III domain-containing protein,Cellulose binding domain-containing protein [Clostridium sp. BNL1100]
MFKKALCVLMALIIMIGLMIPQTVQAESNADMGESSIQSDNQRLTVQLQRVDSILVWFANVILNHGYEDWFPDNNSCSDYNYDNGMFQFIKVKITNTSDSAITLNSNNQLVLRFTNKSGKELGLKIYEFSAYKNIDKSNREYTFGSSLLSNRTIKSHGTWEIYGYVKWMNFSDLGCTIVRQPDENKIQVRLTEKSYPTNPSEFASKDRIHSVLKLYNEGNKDIDLDKIRIHYYFNMDGDLNKVAPKTEKVEGKIYNYQSGRSNPQEDVIQTLPSVFINMGEYSTPKANSFIEIGFPSKSNGSGYMNCLYKFLRYFSSLWNDKFIKRDLNWLDDILERSTNCSSDKDKHRWWWNWSQDYTISSKNYELSAKSGNNTSHADIELEIVKEFIAQMTGDTSNLRKFNQANHYSFNPGEEMDWERVTVYYNGELIWGKEPGQELAAPETLQAISKRDGILLRWDEVNGAEGYKLWRKGPGDSDFVQLPQILSDSSFTDNNVTPGGTYTYKVQAVSDSGEQSGPFSNEASATALIMTGNGLYAEYYNWKPVAGSSLTNYGYDLGNNFTTNYVMENTELAMSRIDPKIDFTKDNADTYYRWGDKAPDPKVNADHYSVVWSGYIMPEFNEDYTFYTRTDDGVKLWIDLNRNGSFDTNELLISNWQKHSETENSSKSVQMEKGKKYRIRIEYYENEYDAVAKLLWSNPKKAKEVVPNSQLFVDGTINIPKTPTNLKADLKNDSSVVLTWDSVLEAQGYKIYQTDWEGMTTIINVKDNSYTVPNLASGEYKFSVSAWNEAGESAKSQWVKVVVGLGAPQNLGGTVNKKTIYLSWDPVDTASGYRLYRVCDGIQTTVLSVDNTYTDSKVEYGKVYKYFVSAIKEGYEGAKSREITIAVPPDAPANLKAAREGASVQLRWSPAQGAQTYSVLRSDSSDGTYEIIKEGITGTSFKDGSIPEITNNRGVKYYYKVVGVANGAVGPYSNIADAIMYPFVETELGFVTYNIINNSRNPNLEFVLGSYVPVSFELQLKNRTSNPGIVMDKDMVNKMNINENPFFLELVSKNIKATVKKKDSTEILKVSDSNITKKVIKVNDKYVINIEVNGTYDAGDVVKIEFGPKVSTYKDDDVENYYGNMYQLKLGLYVDGHGSYEKPIATDINKNMLAPLEVKIANPNKLN